jgi:hypothetical protein
MSGNFYSFIVEVEFFSAVFDVLQETAGGSNGFGDISIDSIILYY